MKNTWVNNVKSDTRRVAKRAYVQWENQQEYEQLKEARMLARKEVAADDLRKHVDCLVELAQALARTIGKAPSLHMETAEEGLLGLWRTDIVGKYGVYGRPEDSVRKTYSPEVCATQNQLLFESLKAHAREKALERVLGEWEQAWDTCHEALTTLRKEADDVLTNVLENKKLLKKGSRGHLIEGVLHVVWEGEWIGKPGRGPVVVATPLGDGRTKLLFGKGQHDLFLSFPDRGLAEETRDACIWAATNLGASPNAERLKGDVDAVNKAARAITDILNPLTLRALILRARCDLCPA